MYSFAFPWDDPKTFTDIDVSEVQMQNADNGVNVFEQCIANEFDFNRALVLYSEIPLDQSVLKPTRVYGPYHIYDFRNPLDKKDFTEFVKAMLLFYPIAQQKKYHPVGWCLFDWEMMPIEHDTIDNTFITNLVLYKKRYDKVVKDIYTSDYTGNLDQKAYDDVRKFLSVKKVADAMNIDITGYYNEYLDRVINNTDNSSPFGDALTFAYLAHKRNMTNTKEFLAKVFQYEFTIIDTDEPEQMSEMNIISQGTGFFRKAFDYWCEDTKMTDFVVRVKYIIGYPDGGKKYIVDLIGEETAESIIWPGDFSKNSFKKAISHYGPFHFMGPEAMITSLHQAISMCDAPVIAPLIGFWFHKHILACSNCVYDLEKHVMYEKGGEIYYNDEVGSGYIILDTKNNNISHGSHAIPVLKSSMDRHTTDEYVSYFRQFYKDDLGELLFYYVLGLIYAGRFRYLSDFKYPYLVLNGLYGSGKSTISDMVKRIYNFKELEKAQISYEQTSVFAFLSICSHRVGLPIFITEFKDNGENTGKTKESYLVQMYDRTRIQKGTASQDLLSYDLNALAVIDWEELPERSALKSRSIILDINRDNNAMSGSDYKRVIKDALPTHLFWDALNRDGVNEKEYRSFVLEWMEAMADILPQNITPRLLENAGGIYAWVMMFDSSLKENAIRIISECIDKQNQLEKDTYWAAELLDIINQHSHFFTDSSSTYWDSRDWIFYIPVAQIKNLIGRYRIRTSLDIKAVMKYLQVKYIEINEWQMECAYWKIDRDTPKQILIFPEANKRWKLITSITPDTISDDF